METLDLVTMYDASRILDISTQRLRDIANKGKIPCHKLSNGERTFLRADVLKLKAERDARGKWKLTGRPKRHT